MHERAEVEAAIEAYLAVRRGAIAGERPWTDLAELFTDDVVFVDCVWGRHEGRERVVRFLADSMAGLEEWDFPHRWHMVDGDRVVLAWANRLPGRRPDGGSWDVDGFSILEYAGDGKFRFEYDLFSESNLYAQLRESGWVPPATMKAPPDDRTW